MGKPPFAMQRIEKTTDKMVWIDMGLKEAWEHLALKWKHHGMKLSGICGVLAPIVAFAGIFLAIAAYPEFSWQNNALSDMGSSEGITRMLFNNGLILGGLIGAVFAAGFFLYLKNGLLGKASAAIFFLDALALTAIGVFPGDFAPQTHIHYYVSVAFFALFPISGIMVAVSFWKAGRKRLVAFTVALAAVAAAVWVAHWTIYPFGSDVAIPEIVAASAAGIWSVAIGVSMFRASDE